MAGAPHHLEERGAHNRVVIGRAVVFGADCLKHLVQEGLAPPGCCRLLAVLIDVRSQQALEGGS
eukprot:3071704-Pleurochrysis_carterae.AAC.1